MALRPHPGQADSAANLRALLASSGVVASHRTPDCTRVQDAYSLRCAPQVHGAARDTVAHAAHGRRRASSPSAIDNPVVTLDGRVESQRQLPRRAGRVRARLPRHRRGGRREHERAADRPRSSTGPATTGCRRSSPHDAGVDSGLMIAQYTAAGLVSRAQAAGGAGVASTRSRRRRCRRTTSRWAGTPARKLRRAVDGAGLGARDRAAHGGPGAGAARAPLEPAAATAAVVAAAARGRAWRAPARTGTWRRRSPRRPTWSAPGGAVGRQRRPAAATARRLR